MFSLKKKAFRHLTMLGAPSSSKNTIVVVGSSRSGTTWLSEILSSPDGYKFLNEPLHLGLHPDARDVGFSWRPYIPRNAEEPEARRYLERALTGRLSIRRAWHFKGKRNYVKAWEHLRNRKLIVKFCRAHRLLGWMDRQFSVAGIVSLVRHPCAVIASMLDHESWDDKNIEFDSYKNFARMGGVPSYLRKKIDNVITHINTKADALAMLWAVDNALMLRTIMNTRNRSTIVRYEDMIDRGREEVYQIIDDLKVDISKNRISGIKSPSAFSSEDLKTSEKNKQKKKWKNKLSKRKSNRIMEISKHFGIRFEEGGVSVSKAK